MTVRFGIKNLITEWSLMFLAIQSDRCRN